jgi:hypothetical protein
MTLPEPHPYQTRTVRFHGVDRPTDRVVKTYGIALQDGAISEGALDQGRRVAALSIPSPAPADGVYGVGHLIVHEGEHAIWTLVQWWRDEDALEQLMLRAPLGRPQAAVEHRPRVIGCAWELAVTAFERDAWVRHVLQDSGGGRLERYLAETLEGAL